MLLLNCFATKPQMVEVCNYGYVKILSQHISVSLKFRVTFRFLVNTLTKALFSWLLVWLGFLKSPDGAELLLIGKLWRPLSFWEHSVLFIFVFVYCIAFPRCNLQQSSLRALQAVPLTSWLGFCCVLSVRRFSMKICGCCCFFYFYLFSSVYLTKGRLNSRCKNILASVEKLT